MRRLLLALVLLAGPAWAEVIPVPATGDTFSGTTTTLVGTTSVCSVGELGTADSFCLSVDALIAEGATADDFETTLAVTDPTADRTITFPNLTGTLLVGGAVNAVTLTNSVYAVTSSIKLSDNAELQLGTLTTDSALDWTTADTPNGLRWGLAGSNTLQFMDYLDRGNTVYDNGPWGTSAATDTSIALFSNDGTSANKWFYLWHDEANAHIASGTGGVIGFRYAVEVVTTTKTPASTTDSTDEGCELYTNTGDADGSTITLPNDPVIGSCYIVAVVVAQTVEVIPNTNELLYIPGDQCTVDVTSATQGAILEFIAVTGGDAGIWFAKGDTTGWACNDA